MLLFVIPTSVPDGPHRVKHVLRVKPAGSRGNSASRGAAFRVKLSRLVHQSGPGRSMNRSVHSTSSSKKIADFAASLLPDRAVRRVDSPEALADARSEHPDLPVSALVTAKDATGSLYKSLALRFRRRAVFVEVHADHVAAVLPDAGLAPEDAPALVVLPSADADAAPAARHEGEMNAASLAAFLDARVAPTPEDDAPEERDPREENARDRHLADKRTRGKSPEDTSMFPAVTPGDLGGTFSELKSQPMIVSAGITVGF